jgi:sec-independent protein translocase protein TatA
MFNNVGSGEILVVLFVLLFLFGGKKLPELAKGLGESSKEIKKAKREINIAKKEIEGAISDIKSDVILNDEEKPSQPTQEESMKGGEPQ